MQKVTLEDPQFEDKFEVYSTDQIEARYLLTTSFMERLLALSRLFSGQGLQAAFHEKHLLLLLNAQENMFEASSIFQPATFTDDIQTILEEMKQIFSLIDHLKLYEQTRL
jgi:Protein of unknown function (DUF3137)